MKNLRHYIRVIVATWLAVWGVVPLLLSLVWLWLRLVMGGFGGLQQSFNLITHNLGNPGGGGFWVWVFLCLAVSLGVVVWARLDASEDGVKGSFGLRAVSWVFIVLLAGSLFQVWHLSWQNSKNVARYYDQAAVVYTPSISNAPGALQYLVSGAKQANNGCYVASSDVPGCIKVGTLAAAGFYPRVSSATGALTVMQSTSGDRQNVNLMTGTLTYLNGDGKNGVWSAIRDGTGPFQPTEGVVEWPGTGLPTECKFGGTDQFNKAINGVKSNSLVNYLTKLYPNLYWSNSDIWGYCKGSNPVLVFPVETQTRYLSQTVSTPAGVLIVSGSASGNPTVTYETHAANLAGPVYPKSMADTQLASMNWMAGRGHLDRGQFGFEPTNSVAQAGNTQDYLLKSKSDGHTYWVTPLTLGTSQSNLFVAYAMVRADTVSAGSLNTFSTYALTSNDARMTNVDQLEAQAKSFMVTNAGGFIPSGGQLIEFTPANGNFWRAFGEINGRVIYRLDISTQANVAPILVSLTSATGATGGSGTGSTASGTGSSGSGSGTKLAYCGNSVSSLTNAQRLACLRLFAGNVN